MNFGLTDEQQMIVDTVRSFVENEIYPHEDAVERSGTVPSRPGWGHLPARFSASLSIASRSGVGSFLHWFHRSL